MVPFGVAVSPQVRNNQMIVLMECITDPVPRMAMVLYTVNQKYGGCLRISPVQIVKSQSL